MSESWEEHRLYIVQEIKSIKGNIATLQATIQDIRISFAVLNTKVLMAGGLMGIMGGLASALVLKMVGG